MHTPETRERAYRKIRERRALWLAENGPCVICSSSMKLEVDHVDPSQKVSHNVWSWSEERRAKELAKCQVLCERCHKEKTKREKQAVLRHGTDTMYSRYKCRCDKCKVARAEKKATTRRRRKLAGLPYQ